MMKFFRKIAATVFFVIYMLLPLTAFAQAQFSILPATKDDDTTCRTLINSYNASQNQKDFFKGSAAGTRDDLLGCGIKTGQITLAMIPYYVSYATNFLLGLSGLVSVLFIVIGGYHYVIGGLNEDKEKGKKTIMFALAGMGLALLAWTIVNVVMSAVSG